MVKTVVFTVVKKEGSALDGEANVRFLHGKRACPSDPVIKARMRALWAKDHLLGTSLRNKSAGDPRSKWSSVQVAKRLAIIPLNNLKIQPGWTKSSAVLLSVNRDTARSQ